MKRSLKGFLIVLATASAGALAEATWETRSDMPHQEGKRFTDMDGNRDGVLTEAEVEKADFTGNFADMDRNRDDEIDRNEYYQYYRDLINQEQR